MPGPRLCIVPSFRVPPCSEHLPWEEKTSLLSMRGQSSWCRRAVAPAPSLAAQPVPFSQLPRLGMVEEGRQLLTNPMKMAHLRAARGFLRPAAEEHMGVLMADFSLECLAPYCTAVKLKILVNGPAARWMLQPGLAVQTCLMGVKQWRELGQFECWDWTKSALWKGEPV